MRTVWAILVALPAFFLVIHVCESTSVLHEKRGAATDLELGGNLAGLPPGSTRFIAREQLLGMPEVSFTVDDDPNFTGPTKIDGILLDELARRFGAPSAADMVVAICDDNYSAFYPRSYLAAHHPVLVLKVNGSPPSGWPKDAHDHRYDMGPYIVTQGKFSPSFSVLSHVDEAQIPWGVVRIEFRDENVVYHAISPRGPHAQDVPVQNGFRIAQQNCLRCHDSEGEGGRKSGRSWKSLSELAANSPEAFAEYIRNPAAKDSHAQMPGNPQYDEATVNALTDYFKTFSQPTKP
jgi:mono/diheme cytochrome c family protein